jgi:hypothetical protein
VGPGVGLAAHQLSVLALAVLTDFVDAIHFRLLMILSGVNVLLDLPQRRMAQHGCQRRQRHTFLRCFWSRTCAEGHPHGPGASAMIVPYAGSPFA